MLYSAMIPAAPTDRAGEIIQKIQKLIQDGNVAEAQAQVSKGLKEFPNNGPLYGLLAVVEANEGNYTAAETHFKKAIDLIPNFAGGYLDLGRFYLENAAKDPEAPKKALDTYERLLRLQPNNGEALYQSAFLQGRQGSFQASLARLARLPAADQEGPQALAVKCAALAGLGRIAEAAAVADSLLQNPYTTEPDILQMLPILEAHNASQLAERVLRAQTARHPSFESFYALGLLEKGRGDLAQARVTLEQAAQYRPQDVPLLIDLARVARDQHDRKGALGYLAHARDLEPENGSIHFFWGIVCIEENLFEEAYQSLQRAVALTPDNPQYVYALGAVVLQRKDLREAILLFQKYRRLKPGDPSGRLALGAAYLENSDFDKARQELEAAAKNPKTAPGVHYCLGRLDNRTGDYRGALREFGLAVQANPNSAQNYAQMGALYVKLQDYRQAEKALGKALELDPVNYTANMNLMILYARTKDPRASKQAEQFRRTDQARGELELDMLRTIKVQP
jgi:tetratricopeptide (TPR) repeat protein